MLYLSNILIIFQVYKQDLLRLNAVEMICQLTIYYHPLYFIEGIPYY